MAKKKRITRCLCQSHRMAVMPSPATAPPATTQAGFTFHRSNAPRATPAITHVGHPRSASSPSLKVTPAISATAPTFTASRNADIHGDCRRRNKTGASRGYIKERRQKNRDRGHGGSRYPSQNVSDEGCGREHRTRRELADCDRVQQLQVRAARHAVEPIPVSRKASSTYPPP